MLFSKKKCLEVFLSSLIIFLLMSIIWLLFTLQQLSFFIISKHLYVYKHKQRYKHASIKIVVFTCHISSLNRKTKFARAAFYFVRFFLYNLLASICENYIFKFFRITAKKNFFCQQIKMKLAFFFYLLFWH
jgi:hypothetical protein